jgi:hypothetical protein
MCVLAMAPLSFQIARTKEYINFRIKNENVST